MARKKKKKKGSVGAHIGDHFTGAAAELVKRLSAEATELDRLFGTHVLDGITVPDYDTRTAALITSMAGVASTLLEEDIKVLAVVDGKPFKPRHYEYSDRDIADRSSRQYYHSLFRRTVDMHKNRDGDVLFIPHLVVTRPAKNSQKCDAYYLIETRPT